jgi:hypothetical protein
MHGTVFYTQALVYDIFTTNAWSASNAARGVVGWWR